MEEGCREPGIPELGSLLLTDMTGEEAGHENLSRTTEFGFSLVDFRKPLEDFIQGNDVIRFVFPVVSRV